MLPKTQKEKMRQMAVKMAMLSRRPGVTVKSICKYKKESAAHKFLKPILLY